ncbi:MAG: zinc dependent phospholipase C family protein [Acidobacteriota bacterium]|nr:zinc dependent phospholipase C family protein [Acidobacteriota bacterium]
MVLAGAALSVLTPPASGYALITHQQLIDVVWDTSIEPLLLSRFPKASRADLERAHAYAYGGCLVQDLGYYPFGKKIFSDFTHYVRSGDFVLYLLRNARNPDELAFAVGALSHYLGDSVGHPEAVNPSTALSFPPLADKYGPVVTYEEAPRQHVRTEFGFDVAQTALHHFAPRKYRQQVGFAISPVLLARAFGQTYGLPIRSILGRRRPAISSYRSSVRKVLPFFTEVAVINARNKLSPSVADAAHARFLEDSLQADYQRLWSNAYKRPGLGAHVVACIVRILPKIGVLQLLSVKAPTPVTDDLYVRSVNLTLDRFRSLLARLRTATFETLTLANLDLDTGSTVRPGGYALTDKTYETLLAKVTADPARPVPEGLRQDILTYYSDVTAPIATKKHPKRWRKVQEELIVLAHAKATNPNP